MIVKTYGIYDSIQEEYIRTFTASNDNDARRSAALIVRAPDFNDTQYKDRAIHYLYSFDTETGKVTDIDVHPVFLFVTAIEERKSEDINKTIQETVMTDAFKDELKDLILTQLKGELKNDSSNN